MQEVQDEFPFDRVEGFSYVKLEQKGRGLALVEASSKVPHIHEVAMDASLFYEGALGVGDEGIHMRGKPQGEHLSNDFGNGMDEAYGPIIRDAPRAILLGQEHHIGGVQPLKIGRVKGVKPVDDSHDIRSDDGPTFLEKDTREAVRAGSLAAWHFFNGVPNLLLSDSVIQGVKVDRLHVELLPIEVKVARVPLPHDLREVVMDDLFFFAIVINPTACELDAVDVILSSSGIDAAVEELCVCITLLEVRDSGALALSGPLQNCQTDHPAF